MSLMAQLPTTVSASFGLDLERLRGLGITDPRSTDAMKILQSGQLGSDERLFLSLWGSKHLNTAFFEPKKRIFKAGAAVDEAYIVTSGSVIALSSDKVFRFGPGCALAWLSASHRRQLPAGSQPCASHRWVCGRTSSGRANPH